MKIRANNPYVVSAAHTLYPDFRLTPCRLIIEIDGGIHLGPALDRDCKRDFWFEERGYKVLHLSNADADTMTCEELARRIQQVYPSFPVPTPQMDHDFKVFRERNNPLRPRLRLALKKQKMSGKMRRHLESQRQSWKRYNEKVASQ